MVVEDSRGWELPRCDRPSRRATSRARQVSKHRQQEEFLKTRRGYARSARAVVATALLSVLLLFVAVPRMHADDRAKCRQRIEKAEAGLVDHDRRR